MAEKITRDTGMMQRTDIKYRMDDPSEVEGCIAAFMAWADSFPVAEPGDWPGDALRRQNAERCRAILATAGIADDGTGAVNTALLREKGLAENSAQWLAAHWLAEYHILTRGRERFAAGDTTPGNVARMLMATEAMGRLRERLWWRAGVDHQTEKKRETLAISGRRQVKGGKDGNAMRADTSFKALHGAEAQAYADDLHNRQPSMTWAAMRNAVAKRFNVSAETVKKALTNPKKHG